MKFFWQTLGWYVLDDARVIHVGTILCRENVQKPNVQKPNMQRTVPIMVFFPSLLTNNIFSEYNYKNYNSFHFKLKRLDSNIEKM